MENQNHLKDLLAALCKAQSEYPDIPKTRVGQEGNRKFKYADLNDIHKATRQINAKHGLSTPHETTDTHLITRLYHAPSGQFLSTQLPIKLTDQPKHTGATLTYLKRYNIQSLLDISTEEDLDSIDTSGKPQTPDGTKIEPPKPQSISDPGVPPVTPIRPEAKITEPQLKRLFAIASSKGWTHEHCKFYIREAWNLETSKDLNRVQYDKLVQVIETLTYIEALKELGK